MAMHKYIIAKLFYELPNGSEFAAGKWPLHVTVANFSIGMNVEVSPGELLHVSSDVSMPVRVRGKLRCCGCGSDVADGRKFVNQDHYNQTRSLSPADAQRVVERFREGVSKHQL